MGQTKIGWTDYTFNPVIDCEKVSEGFVNCYAEEQDARKFSKTCGGTKDAPVKHWGKGAPRYVTSEDAWKKPVRWNREAVEWKRRPRVFCASLSDWLDEAWPVEVRARLLKLIFETPNLDWLLLTKRPENFRWLLGEVCRWIARKHGDGGTWAGPLGWLDRWNLHGDAPHHIWIGVTTENQKRADERVPLLLEIPARVRFLSVEPMLERMELFTWVNTIEGKRSSLPVGGVGQACEYLGGCSYVQRKVDWVIGGLESGGSRRDGKVEWLQDLREQCRAASVAFFCKQDNHALPGMQGRIPDELWHVKEWPGGGAASPELDDE